MKYRVTASHPRPDGQLFRAVIDPDKPGNMTRIEFVRILSSAISGGFGFSFLDEDGDQIIVGAAALSKAAILVTDIPESNA